MIHLRSKGNVIKNEIADGPSVWLLEKAGTFQIQILKQPQGASRKEKELNDLKVKPDIYQLIIMQRKLEKERDGIQRNDGYLRIGQ